MSCYENRNEAPSSLYVPRRIASPAANNAYRHVDRDKKEFVSRVVADIPSAANQDSARYITHI